MQHTKGSSLEKQISKYVATIGERNLVLGEIKGKLSMLGNSVLSMVFHEIFEIITRQDVFIQALIKDRQTNKPPAETEGL